MNENLALARVWLARAAVVVGLIAAVWGVLARLGVLIGAPSTLFTAAAAAFLFAIFLMLDRWEAGVKKAG